MMKYYQVTVHRKYTAPNPIGWYGIIDSKTIEQKGIHGLQNRILLHVDKHMQMIFTDVIMVPCFMVSTLVRDVIKVYASDTFFARIILFDQENRRSKAYYIPDIPLAEEWNKKRVIMRVQQSDIGKETVIMRMDLVESILRRGAVGIGLEEYEEKGEGSVIY